MTKNISLSFFKFLLVFAFIATQNPLFAAEEPDDSPQAAASVPCTLKPSIIKEISEMDAQTFVNFASTIFSLERHAGAPITPLKTALEGLASGRWGHLTGHLNTLSPEVFPLYARQLRHLTNAATLKAQIKDFLEQLIEHMNTLSLEKFPSYAEQICYLAYSVEDDSLKTQVKHLVSARSSQLTEHLDTLSLQEFPSYAKKLSNLTFALRDNPGDTTSPLEARLKELVSARWDGLFDHLTRLPLEEFPSYVAKLFRLTFYDHPTQAILFLKRKVKVRAQIASKWDPLQEDLFKLEGPLFWKSASAYFSFIRADHQLFSIKHAPCFPPLPRWHAETEKMLVGLLSERLQEFTNGFSTIALAEFSYYYPAIELLRGIEETPGPLTQGLVAAVNARFLS